ncbi:MAG: tetratricopeptide repeat protein [Chloroflexota bacterium]|nr:tetratricopeptide repeat protein [Chloroflexota bacterium]
MELGGLASVVLGLLMAGAGVALIVVYWRGRNPVGPPAQSSSAVPPTPAPPPVIPTPAPPTTPPLNTAAPLPHSSTAERMERLQQLRAQHSGGPDPIAAPPDDPTLFDPPHSPTPPDPTALDPTIPLPLEFADGELLAAGEGLPPRVSQRGARSPRYTAAWRGAVAQRTAATGSRSFRTIVGVVIVLGFLALLIGLLVSSATSPRPAPPGTAALIVAEFGSGPAFTRDDSARAVADGIRLATMAGGDATRMPVNKAGLITNAADAVDELNRQHAQAVLWGTMPSGINGPISATLTWRAAPPPAPWVRYDPAAGLLVPAQVPLPDQPRLAPYSGPNDAPANSNPLTSALQALQRYGIGDYEAARAQAARLPSDAPPATANLAAFVRANSLLLLGQPTEARAIYAALDARGWHDPAVLNNWGVAALQAQDAPAARAAFDRAAAAQPAPSPTALAIILTNRGLAAEAAGDYAGALAAYDAALKSDPKSGPANRQRGWLAYRLSDSAGATLYTAKAAVAQPDNPALDRQAGLIALMQRQPQSAVSHFARATDRYNVWISDLSKTEGAANSRSNSSEAIRASEQIRALNVEKGTTAYYTGLAYTEMAQGKPRPGFLEQAWRNLRGDKTEAERAIAAFQEAIRLNQDRAGVRYQMGLLYRQQGDRSNARAQFAKAKELQADAPGAYEALAEMDLEDKQPAAALAEYQALLKANPSYMPALIKMGDIYSAGGDNAGKLRTYGAVAAITATTPQEHFWRAQALAALDRRDEAIAEARTAIDGDPNLWAAHLLLGNLYRDAHSDDAANAEYASVLKAQPANVEALYEIGKLEALHGNTDAARDHWQQVAKIQPDHPEVHFALGKLYEQRAAQATQAGKPDEANKWLDAAIGEYNTAIAKNAGKPDALLNLGQLQEQRGNWKEAEKRYSEAIKGAPNLVEARQGLVRVLLKQPGRDGDALKAAQDFGRLAPNDARAPKLLGTVFLFRDDPNSALTQYQAALRLQPGDPEAYYGLGRAYQLQGDPAQARQNYQAALTAQPGSPAALTGLGDLALDGGQYGQAQEYYTQAQQADANYAPAWVGLGRALNRLSVTQPDLANKARDALTHAATLDPTAAEPHFYLGEIYAERALWAKAIAEYTTAANLHPSWAMPQFRLGQVYLSQKQTAEALKAYQQATKLDPQLLEGWFGLGQAEREVGNRKEAINAYRKAIALKGDYAAAWLYLGYTLEEDGQRPEAVDAFNHAAGSASDDIQIRNAAQEALRGH